MTSSPDTQLVDLLRVALEEVEAPQEPFERLGVA